MDRIIIVSTSWLYVAWKPVRNLTELPALHAGVASAIRSSLDRAQSPGGLPGGGVAAAGGGGLSVDAITQAARQVSLTVSTMTSR